jgi:hypothetical protein
LVTEGQGGLYEHNFVKANRTLKTLTRNPLDY